MKEQNVYEAYEKFKLMNVKLKKEKLKMKTERNLFKEWKESQLMAANSCKITETGEVLWNEVIIIDLLEKLGCRKVLFGKDTKFLRYLEDKIEEINYKEIKDLILERMNCTDSQRERIHLIRNNIFFSEDLLNNLKEAIPDKVNDSSLEFFIGEGYLMVTQDEISMNYCA